MANSSWLSEKGSAAGWYVSTAFFFELVTNTPSVNPSKLVDLGVNINQRKMNSSYVP
jgi:hypothetical protein